jgi:hypothetical protein
MISKHSLLLRELALGLFQSIRPSMEHPKMYESLSKEVKQARRFRRSITSKTITRLLEVGFKLLGDQASQVLGNVIGDHFDRSTDWSNCSQAQLNLRLRALNKKGYYRSSQADRALWDLYGRWVEKVRVGKKTRYSVGLFYEKSDGLGYLGTVYDTMGRRTGAWHSKVIALDRSLTDPVLIYRYGEWQTDGPELSGFGEIPLEWNSGRLVPKRDAVFIDVKPSKNGTHQLKFHSVKMMRLEAALEGFGSPPAISGHWPSIDNAIKALTEHRG